MLVDGTSQGSREKRNTQPHIKKHGSYLRKGIFVREIENLVLVKFDVKARLSNGNVK